MEKWICKQCGYAHYGKEAPDICPQCGARKSRFYQEGRNGCGFGVILLLMILLAIVISVLMSCSSLTVDNSPVEDVDLKRFLGKWYEIARYDHKFERGMEECTATYTLQNDGKLVITNHGMKNGQWDTSVGKGKLTDEPGVLRVSFWGPFYSDYRIMMLAYDYSYALIGGSTDSYLWILSRTPTLDDYTRDRILLEARRRGYDTSALLWVPQQQNASLFNAEVR